MGGSELGLKMIPAFCLAAPHWPHRPLTLPLSRPNMFDVSITQIRAAPTGQYGGSLCVFRGLRLTG